MEAIAPGMSGVSEMVLAKDQPEYKELPVAFLPRDDGRTVMVSRWKPTPAERHSIASGEDVYVAQFVPSGALFMPMRVDCGPGIWQTTGPAPAKA